MLPGQLFQRLFVVTEEVAQRLVDRLEAARRIRYGHSDGGSLHHPAPAVVGLSLQPAGFLRSLLGLDLGIDQAAGEHQSVRYAVGTVERLEKVMDPMDFTVRTEGTYPAHP